MPVTRNFLALDLGASSGRAVIGRFDGHRLALEEVHRFANGPVSLPRSGGVSLHWDVLDLFTQMKAGIGRAVSCCAEGLASAGIDAWGVDYGLLDPYGELLGNPYHYRDRRTEGMYAEAFARVPRAEVFGSTGIQFMEINTLYQLLSSVVEDERTLKAGPAARIDRLGQADKLLMIPDLLNYWLTGAKVSERTIASTSQLLDPFSGDWNRELIRRLGLPAHIFPPIVAPGTNLGRLLPAVAEETGAHNLTVVAPGCHDTASAVAAVPLSATAAGDQAYLSSGTWSLIGVESRSPVVNARSLELNFTNETGVCHTIRLLKNITGLWIIQECRRQWRLARLDLSWDDIVRAASAATPFKSLIDVDSPEFGIPGDMPSRVQDFCRRTGQPVPEGVGEIARTVFESLAMRYRRTTESLEELTGSEIRLLNIVGGGTQNRLLSQFAANALARPVVAGPIEATAVGNVLMQMLATGDIASLEEGRDIVKRSFDTESFEPQQGDEWNVAFARFTKLL